ncbi:MAG: hypothetical protein AAGB48_10180 [Planctomycetota bacterium]
MPIAPVHTGHHALCSTTTQRLGHACEGGPHAPHPQPTPIERPADRVEFSEYAEALNEEARLRRPQAPDRAAEPLRAEHAPPTAPLERPMQTMPSEASEQVRQEAVERYLVINRAATGRLIDLLM